MFWFISKKKHNAIVAELENKLQTEQSVNDALRAKNTWLSEDLAKLKEEYPLTIGQTVYDVQLRNEKGRYTKTNPVCEYSKVNEVVVDKKNYFNLVERMKAKDVFTRYEAATQRLHEVCVKEH